MFAFHYRVRMAAAAVAVVLAGCGDASYPLQQGFSIGVYDSDTGGAVADAVVTSAPNDPRWASSQGLSSEAYLQRYVGIFPVASDTTNDLGEALLNVRGSGICRALPVLEYLLDWCPPEQLPDRVTGQDFLIGVESGEIAEILVVQMTPGAEVAGDRVDVKVLSVSENQIIGAEAVDNEGEE